MPDSRPLTTHGNPSLLPSRIGSGNYPRCRITGCTYQAAYGDLCERHAQNVGGRKAPSPRQMAESADVLRRFAGSRELSSEELTHVLNAADLMGMAALAQEAKRA